MSETGFTKVESFELAESVLSIKKDKLGDGKTLKIAGFGNFVVNEKNGRRRRNPLTGESITIEARKVLTFKPSLVLKDGMDGDRMVTTRIKHFVGSSANSST
jgi:integration host factor subunit alpha